MKYSDRKLTDKGWASMQAMLDREMPREKRRRPFGWWLAGIFLLLAGGFEAWRHTQLPPVQGATAPGKPDQAHTPVAAAGINVPKKDAGNADAPAASEAESNLFLPSHGTKRFGAHNLIASPKAPDKASEIRPLALSQLPAPDPGFSNFNPFPVTPREIGTDPKSAVLPSPAETKIAKRGTKKQAKIWAFGISAGISTERFIAVNGMSAGLFVDWQPLRKWGMRVGANYQTESPTVQSRPIANVSAKNYNAFLFNRMEVIGYGAGYSYVDPKAEVLIPVDRLHYLELPALIFWQPWRPWRIYAGSTLTRTLYAKSEDYSYVSDQSPAPSSILVESRNLNELATRQLATWHIYGNTGLGFRPHNHLEVGFSGQFDFPGLRKNSDNAQYNASIADAFNSKKSTPKPVYRRFQLSATLFF